MTPNEIELTLWLCVATNFNVIFWLEMRGWQKSATESLRIAKEAMKLSDNALKTSQRWENLYNAKKQNS